MLHAQIVIPSLTLCPLACDCHTSSRSYFKLLLKANWTPDERYPKFQYRDASGTLMMLPSDVVLIEDKDFKPYVELYGERGGGIYGKLRPWIW